MRERMDKRQGGWLWFVGVVAERTGEVVVGRGEVGVEHVDCEPQGARVRAMGWVCRLSTDSSRIRNSIAGFLHTLHRQKEAA